MAVCMPFPLWQRTSRVYQDLLPFGWVLTSFVPPAHKQGASPAPLQGPCPPDKIPAGYWLILCLIVSDQPHSYTSTFRRTFPDALTLLSLPARDRNRISVLTAARFWPRAVLATNSRSSSLTVYAASAIGLWMSPIIFAGSYSLPVVSSI